MIELYLLMENDKRTITILQYTIIGTKEITKRRRKKIVFLKRYTHMYIHTHSYFLSFWFLFLFRFLLFLLPPRLLLPLSPVSKSTSQRISVIILKEKLDNHNFVQNHQMSLFLCNLELDLNIHSSNYDISTLNKELVKIDGLDIKSGLYRVHKK